MSKRLLFLMILVLIVLLFTSCKPDLKGIDNISSKVRIPDNFVYVKGGSFDMGKASIDLFSEKPIHNVNLNYDFLIGKYEITFYDYELFCKESNTEIPYDNRWGKDDRPVINIDWSDATHYCNWLSEKENLPVAYDNNGDLLDKDGKKTDDITNVVGYRLPTEAEWEFAARGGIFSEDFKYSGGNNLYTLGWFINNSGEKTRPIGQKNPNELEIYDMSGNVFEWCNDWFEKYSQEKQINPIGPESGTTKVLRGGSFGNYESNCRVIKRYGYEPTSKFRFIGFRICRSVSPID